MPDGQSGTDLVVALNITPLTRPPCSPEINPVENVWQYLRTNKLAKTSFECYDDIVEASCNAWNFFANDPERIASMANGRTDLC